MQGRRQAMRQQWRFAVRRPRSGVPNLRSEVICICISLMYLLQNMHLHLDLNLQTYTRTRKDKVTLTDTHIHTHTNTANSKPTRIALASLPRPAYSNPTSLASGVNFSGKQSRIQRILDGWCAGVSDNPLFCRNTNIVCHASLNWTVQTG